MGIEARQTGVLALLAAGRRGAARRPAWLAAPLATVFGWRAAEAAAAVPSARVIIGTTNGPVDVLLLTPEATDQSVMCIGGETDQTGVSGQYHAFTDRRTGIIGKLFQQSAFRMDVSAGIDTGTSWQLGAFAAHALFAAGRLEQGLARGAPPVAAIWASGAVRVADGAVRPVEFLAEKLTASIAALSEHSGQGRRAIALVPSENAGEIGGALAEALLRHGIEVRPVSHIREVLEALSLPGRGRSRSPGWLVLVGIAIAGGLLALSLRIASAPAIFEPLPFNPQSDPSFSCARYLRANPLQTSSGRSPEGDLMCHDPQTAAVDKKMGEAYRELQALLPQEEKEALQKVEHQEWRRWRDRRCGITWENLEPKILLNIQCLIGENLARQHEYEERIKIQRAKPSIRPNLSPPLQ
ncbi:MULTISPECIES: lysozyme inhibitor LprI family protein [Rhodomicrobium]|uniref:lysozyme inhibitor LprI family protein n=1 Tax=Rhodomicrobium TaxID=1068 RepID=UPI000B4B6FA6|nr:MULTISPECIES: lysozyme inhibitor LprI family protein [Rhodomicrobium]